MHTAARWDTGAGAEEEDPVKKGAHLRTGQTEPVGSSECPVCTVGTSEGKLAHASILDFGGQG